MPRSSSIASASLGAPARAWADSPAFALALVALLGVAYAVISRVALEGFPYSGDEYSLALQGELLARGVIKAPAPAHIEWLQIDHVVLDQWVRSKYPPGAPALLALGARHGVAWLVTPLEAVVMLLLVWHTTRRALGPRPGLIALVTLGIAPLVMFQAASFYAHIATMMFLAVAFAAVAAWTRGQQQRWLVVVGSALGCAFLIRPVDALLFGVAMLALRSPRAIVVTALSALPWVALNFAYQAAAFGSPFTDGYHAYEPAFRALYGPETAANPLSLAHLLSPVQLWNHIDVYRALVVEWTIPGTALVALFGAYAIDRGHPARALRTFSVALIAVFVVALLPMISDPDDGARPRYLSVTLIPIALLTAAGFAPACAALAARFGRRAPAIFVAIATTFALAQTGSFLQDRIPKLWLREGLYQAAEAAHLTNSVVIVRARHPSRFARNGAFFDRSILYLSPPADVPVETIAPAYPGREIWEAHEGTPWKLVRAH